MDDRAPLFFYLPAELPLILYSFSSHYLKTNFVKAVLVGVFGMCHRSFLSRFNLHNIAKSVCCTSASTLTVMRYVWTRCPGIELFHFLLQFVNQTWIICSFFFAANMRKLPSLQRLLVYIVFIFAMTSLIYLLLSRNHMNQKSQDKPVAIGNIGGGGMLDSLKNIASNMVWW